MQRNAQQQPRLLLSSLIHNAMHWPWALSLNIVYILHCTLYKVCKASSTLYCRNIHSCESTNVQRALHWCDKISSIYSISLISILISGTAHYRREVFAFQQKISAFLSWTSVILPVKSKYCQERILDVICTYMYKLMMTEMCHRIGACKSILLLHCPSNTWWSMMLISCSSCGLMSDTLRTEDTNMLWSDVASIPVWQCEAMVCWV